jgi:hypothetical protein
MDFHFSRGGSKYETRQVLTNLNARDVGGDGFELATDIRWGVHFEVEGILMPDASREVDHDDGFVAITHTSPGFGGEKLRERQCTNGTDFQKLPA